MSLIDIKLINELQVNKVKSIFPSIPIKRNKDFKISIKLIENFEINLR